MMKRFDRIKALTNNYYQVGFLVFICSFFACNEDVMDNTMTCKEVTWYEDADQDGLGDPAVSVMSCDQPNGYVSNNNDNDDNTNSNSCNSTSGTFAINLNPDDCTVSLSQTSSFSMTTNETDDSRTITTNSIPNHLVGQFPNRNNPNTISAISRTYTIDLTPKIANSPTALTRNGRPRYVFGILFSGNELDPIAAEYFTGSSGRNFDWNESPLSNNVNLGTDCNNAHVQPSGKYHYHGVPSAFLASLGVDGTKMVKIGYAADGFPIYYKYIFDESTGAIIEVNSSYQLKTKERGGDGNTAPDGCPDGTYVQDYEYVEGLGPLDACNGMIGKTPESDLEYFYVLTDNWPSSPMCLMGTPSNDFGF